VPPGSPSAAINVAALAGYQRTAFDDISRIPEAQRSAYQNDQLDQMMTVALGPTWQTAFAGGPLILPSGQTWTPTPSRLAAREAQSRGTPLVDPNGNPVDYTNIGGAYASALPPPNQIAAATFLQLSPDTQQFLLAAYEKAGYSPTDIAHLIGKLLPGAAAFRPGSYAPILR
jgi:hypothetical protein